MGEAFRILHATKAVWSLRGAQKSKSALFRRLNFLRAPRVGFEPTTNRLTGDRSTTELPRNIFFLKRTSKYYQKTMKMPRLARTPNQE